MTQTHLQIDLEKHLKMKLLEEQERRSKQMWLGEICGIFLYYKSFMCGACVQSSQYHIHLAFNVS